MKRLLAALLLCTALPVAAETRHQIGKIQFQSRVPTNILLSQSALAEDRTYTDQDLQVAMARLRRLPFIYSVFYKIEGTTLVVDVIDHWRVYYNIGSSVQAANIGGGGSGGSLSGELAGRHYFPWGGVIDGGVGSQTQSHLYAGAWRLDYAQYGIAGTRLAAQVGFSHPTSPHNYAPRFLLAYPLTLRQSIVAQGNRETSSQVSRSVSPGATVSGYRQKDSLRDAEIDWRWDTTNDPLFTTSGAMLSLGPMSNKQTHFFETFSSRPSSGFITDVRDEDMAVI